MTLTRWSRHWLNFHPNFSIRRAMKIRTYTHPIRRAASALWDACDRHQWLPLAIVGVCLFLVNSTWLN